MRWLGAALLVLCGCAQNDVPVAEFWRSDAIAEDGGSLGGWPRAWLATRVGETSFWEETPVTVSGFAVQPGVSNGVSAPFVITDIWKDHPTTWVQPVWEARTKSGAPLPEVKHVFPVNYDSSFYSPFWRLELVQTDALPAAPFTSAREVLALGPMVDGPPVSCPILPEGFFFGRHEASALDPITLTPIAYVGEATLDAHAWVEGVLTHYIDFGPDRYTVTGNPQLPASARAYFFVRGDTLLPVAAVLPGAPKTRSFLTRVDAWLPDGPTVGVYVPAGREALRAKLEALGLRAPVPDAASADVPQHALKVTLDTTCFETPAGIATCKWLDSEAALQSAGIMLVDTTTQVAAAVVSP